MIYSVGIVDTAEVVVDVSIRANLPRVARSIHDRRDSTPVGINTDVVDTATILDNTGRIDRPSDVGAVRERRFSVGILYTIIIICYISILVTEISIICKTSVRRAKLLIFARRKCG